MKGHATLMSKASDEWATPQAFFDWANDRYGPFSLDAAACVGNWKCQPWLLDALSGDSWALPNSGKRVWLNPPYSRVGAFLDRAVIEMAFEHVARVVALVPSRTDTKWWHDTVPYCSEVLLLKGRLKFNEAPASAPFPSALLVIEGPGGSPLIRNCDWRHE